MKKPNTRSPFWIVTGVASLMTIVLGITVGTILTSGKVSFLPQAREGCMTIHLQEGGWDNPEYKSVYTIKFEACNDHDSWFNTAGWFTNYDSEHIWSVDGYWGLPGRILSGECRRATLTITMRGPASDWPENSEAYPGWENFAGTGTTATAEFLVAAEDFCIGTECTGCYDRERLLPSALEKHRLFAATTLLKEQKNVMVLTTTLVPTNVKTTALVLHRPDLPPPQLIFRL